VGAETTPTDQAHTAAREYLSLLQRRKWLILFAVLVVPALAGGLSLQQQKRYQANAQVLLTHQDLAASLLGLPDPNAAVDPTRLAETQASLARSPVVAGWTLRAAGVRDRTPRQFLRQSHVTPRTNQDLLDFAVDDPKPALAIRLVNAYAHQYPRYQLALANKALAGAKADVDREVAALQSRRRTDVGLYNSLLDKRKELATLAALQTTSALGSCWVSPLPSCATHSTRESGRSTRSPSDSACRCSGVSLHRPRGRPSPGAS
jgi:uncharacterized protein involved in exopolysaccharide biosynthesis